MEAEQFEEYVNEFIKTQEELSELCSELERYNTPITVIEVTK